MRVAILGGGGAMGGLIGAALHEGGGAAATGVLARTAGRKAGILAPFDETMVWLLRSLEEAYPGERA